ncbi:MAG: CopG family transcriptional regulator [Clostridiales bacterium 43-6]|nr:MAG: CopG family transcriptional regulator [Clostridiales bacterium 43-6]
MTQKRMGRPPSGEASMKDRIFIRVDKETKEKIRKCREALNMTTSDLVRNGIDRIYDELDK